MTHGVAAIEMRIRGVVQGVGFRPHVYRLAQRYGLTGWVLNGGSGVQLHAEGPQDVLDVFARAVVAEAPPASRVASVDSAAVAVGGFDAFSIRESLPDEHVTVRISPDLPVCDACLRELSDPADRRYRYPYITCTDCGPRYSIVTGLPYDRPFTTMAEWPMCDACRGEYDDPSDRRFHAQPLACPDCGPTYVLGDARGWEAIATAADLLREGAIVAVKGIGGYHLACDAANAASVAALRERKYRKERPFALMARDLATARELIELDAAGEETLTSTARPIVLAPARRELDGVAPDNRELGVMLPYAPLHFLLFAAGAADVLVMTSANRSGEPMAYDDADATSSLAGIADAFLIGERRIARRIDDSVVRAASFGMTVIRRARGMAPQAVASLSAGADSSERFEGARSIIAVGGDLKNAPLLVVDGQAFAAQYVGDLEHLPCRDALAATVRDLCSIYGVREDERAVVHDAHPEYASTTFAVALAGIPSAVQHHRAHIASVVAERGAWDTEVVGIAFDGTGYGDDGTIWGGEIFTGSVAIGFVRAAHLRPVPLPGGDAAARFPVQAAAGFLYDLDGAPDVMAAPFDFPARYQFARSMIAKNVRTFRTSSVGRLFDAVAALLGFTREITFEGQAAMWLEHLASRSAPQPPYELALRENELDHRPMLTAILTDRTQGRNPAEMAYAFHATLVDAIVGVHNRLGPMRPLVASGGVFQNRMLTEMLYQRLGSSLWLNRTVPPNDGGLALGQAAIAYFAGPSKR